jgi:hypothetical protein
VSTETLNRKPARPFRVPWRKISLAVAPLGLLLLAFPGHTEKTYVFRTTSSPRISLSNLSGQVVIRGWDKAQVRAVCSTVSPRVVIAAEPMPASGTADMIRFSTRTLDTLLSEKEETADYTLDVPLGSSLEIRNRQGQVEIQKLTGDARVDTAGASISAADVSGHLSVNSVGGNIEIARPSGRVEASTVFGDLHIIAPASSRVRANTNSGKLVYDGDFLPDGYYVLSSYSGEMDILCPANASFDLSTKSVRGKVFSDPALAPRYRTGNPPSGATSFVGPDKSGNATVELTSFSGNIHIRRQP